MASSSDPGLHKDAVRGFVPPQNDEEKRLVRRAEELCQTALSRGIPRYTGFLSDREQSLAQAGVNRANGTFARFWGGYSQAERKILSLEPPDTWQEEPIAILRLHAQAAGGTPPTHRDYLGALLGLGLERACLGDLIITQTPGVAYAFVLADKVDFITMNLCSAGRCTVRAEQCDTLPPDAVQAMTYPMQQATVPSLRADVVLAAMMHTSRTLAAQAIQAGRVEINHMALHAGHEAVFAKDIVTVRGTGRYRLAEIGGKSKKDRIFIIFYQYE